MQDHLSLAAFLVDLSEIQKRRVLQFSADRNANFYFGGGRWMVCVIQSLPRIIDILWTDSDLVYAEPTPTMH